MNESQENSSKSSGAYTKNADFGFPENPEMTQKTFESDVEVVRSAFLEFLEGVAGKESGKTTTIPAYKIEEFVNAIKKDITGDKKFTVGALVTLEAGLYALGKKMEKFLEMKENAVFESSGDAETREQAVSSGIEKRGDASENQGDLGMRIEYLASRMAWYAETENFLFSHSEFSQDIPARNDFIEWLKTEKQAVENGAKNELYEILQKKYISRLKSEVPAFDRFLNGRQVIGDYDIIMSVIENSIDNYRDALSDHLEIEFQNLGTERRADVEPKLKKIYELRAFLSLLEGERNERIALQR